MKQKLFIPPNADKDGIKEPYDLRDPSNFVRGSRILICGRPGAGKTALIKNLIVHQMPMFDEILICHIDLSSREYEDLDGTMTSIDELPEPEDIDPEVKTLVILEDCDFDSYSKHDREKINKYMRYVCSHKGLSLIIACQDMFAVPSTYRKKVDMYILFRFDPLTLSMIARRCGLTKEEMHTIFNHYCKSQHDSITIDLTGHPAFIRHNLFHTIRSY